MKMNRLSKIILASGAVLAVGWAARADSVCPVQPGDTLPKLADLYYGDSRLWPAIALANQLPVGGQPPAIHQGQKLVIPDAPSQLDETSGPAAPSLSAATAVPLSASPLPVNGRAAPGAVADDFSLDMPPTETGQFPSTVRQVFPEDWRKDGSVLASSDPTALWAAGDVVLVKIEEFEPSSGSFFGVYRLDGPKESDPSGGAVYVRRIAVGAIVGKVSSSVFRLRLLKVGDAVEAGDWVKKL